MKKRAVFVAGAIASGKTTFMRAVRERLVTDVRVFDADEVVEAMVRVSGGDMRDGSLVGKALQFAVRQMWEERIPVAMKSGKNFMVQGMFHDREDTVMKKRWIESQGYEVMLACLECPLVECRRRNMGRERELPGIAVDKSWNRTLEEVGRWGEDFEKMVRIKEGEVESVVEFLFDVRGTLG